MANINDFKLVNKKANKYFEIYDFSKDIRDEDKTKLGFYLFILECVTNNTDINELKNCVIDTEYRSLVFNEKNDDLGIDAVYIDENDLHIQLFNFKFRSKFKANKGQNLNNLSDSDKFMKVIESENLNNLTKSTKNVISEIIDKLNSNEQWKMTLYMVSNENFGLEKNQFMENFSEVYDMSIKSISLDDIIGYVSEKHDDINAKFIVDKGSVMPYKEDELDSDDSYLIKLSLDILMKITCKDVILRNDIDEFNIKSIEKLEFEPKILNDNVRGFLGETKYNTKIIKTIGESPQNFFLFNNGITIVANDIKGKPINGKKMFKCELEGMSIVNGGQTIRSIYKYFDDDNSLNSKLSKAYVLVRFISTGNNDKLKNNVAEYTNSQNAISVFDIKSINNIQIELERYLKENDILYVRKAGDTGKIEENYEYRMSKETLAQILYSVQGNPDKATNQKKSLFSNRYDEIFNEELNFDNVIEYIKKYNEVEKIYSESSYNGFNSKYLYILYISEQMKGISFEKCIEILEEVISLYKKDEQNLSDARKLIQKAFKSKVDETLSNSKFE
ncbi:AIPR family protein [Staphylococcus taiwanensis]|nr:AIPR family protein [Staphylococcus taiwanensis]